MTYTQTLQKELKKSEETMLSNASEMLECSQYELGYQDGIKFALQEYNKYIAPTKNYNELHEVITAAAEIANQLRTSLDQALKECNNKGFKFIRANKDNKTIHAKFVYNDSECKIRIKNDKCGTLIQLKNIKGNNA